MTFILFINFPLGQCQSDDFSWDDHMGSNYNKIEENDKSADILDTSGKNIDVEIPFFFWLFLIMVGIWYLFVFRVLCCDKTCRNLDVVMGMKNIKSPFFTNKSHISKSLKKCNLFF